MRTILRRLHDWRTCERGSSTVVVFILALPLMLIAFGFAFDFIRLAYVKTYTQGRLDMAVQSGASITYTTDRGNIRFGEVGYGDLSLEYAQDNYVLNTSGKRADGLDGLLICPDAELTYDQTETCSAVFEVQRPPTLNQSTDFCSDADQGELYGVRGTVTETIEPVFLRIFGIREFTYTIHSFAPLRGSNC